MKKSLKLLSMILAILMMAATLPMAVFATEGAEASNGIDLSGYADGYTIMTAPGAMAPLADNVHSNLPEGTLTTTGLNVGGPDWEADLDNTVGATSYDLENANSGKLTYIGNGSGWLTISSAIKTNLPLNEDSQYTLTFDAKYAAGNAGKLLMFWMSEGTKAIHGVGLQHSDSNGTTTDKLSYLSNTGTRTDVSTALPTPVVPYAGEWILTDMLVQVEINGTTQTVYINGVQVHQQTVSYDDCDGYLYLGTYIAHHRSYSKNKTVAAFDYVSVQKGCVATDTTKTPELITIDNLAKGDVIMTADAAFAPAVNSVKSSLTTGVSVSSANYFADWMFDNGTAGYNSYDAEEAINNGQWLYRGTYGSKANNSSGIKTDLPLNENSQYTLTFDATYSAGVVGKLTMWWMSEGTKAIYGVGMRTDETKNYLELLSDTGEYSETELPNLILKPTGEWNPTDMLVRVDINGTTQTVYINGVKVHEQVVDYSKCDGYLYLGSMVYHHAGYSKNKVIADFDGVTVQKGLVANEVIATYTDVAGNDLGWNWNTKNETVAFPAVDVAEGHTLVWKTADGAVVDPATYVITEDTAFVAYQMHDAEVKFFGVQQSLATEDGKCQLRVLATLKGLDAQNAGFDVEAKYMNGETLVERTDLGSYVTVVYDKINATKNNTVRTVDAEENGGNYIMGLVINGVPVGEGQIDFYIKAFVTIDGVKVYSDTDYRTVSLVDGKLTADATLLGAVQ